MTNDARSIVIIDDDIDILEVSSTIASLCKVTSRTFSAPKKALSHLLEECKAEPTSGEFSVPLVILLDLKMPEIDGHTVLSQVRATPHLENVPVIMLTAVGGIDEKLRAFEAGADDYLTKPFEAKELQARLLVWLRVRELQLSLGAEAARLSSVQEELIERERALAVQQLSGGALHALGQPIASLAVNVYLLKKQGSDPELAKLTAALDQDVAALKSTLESLREAAQKPKAVYHRDLEVVDIGSAKE